MHTKEYSIVISEPAHHVFMACLDPKNTPLGIDGIVEEQASELPAKLGTIYKNRGATGHWSLYTITEFEQDTVFKMSRKDGAFHVRYVFKQLCTNQTELTYSEWEDDGVLEHPLPETAIHKLKQLIEDQQQRP